MTRTPAQELAILRLSLKRVAQVANADPTANVTIPNEGDERGWNRLCADLIGYLETLNRPPESVSESWQVAYLKPPTAQDRKREAFMTRAPSIELFDTEHAANTFAAAIRHQGGTAVVGRHGTSTGFRGDPS